MKRFAIALAALMLAMPAKADNSFTVEALYVICGGPGGAPADQVPLKKGLCGGYVMGVGHAMILAGLDPGIDKRTLHVAACPDAGSDTGNAMVPVFKNWAAKHPQHWGDMAVIGVTAAIREAWPCH
jgi:hypothetical protein